MLITDWHIPVIIHLILRSRDESSLVWVNSLEIVLRSCLTDSWGFPMSGLLQGSQGSSPLPVAPNGTLHILKAPAGIVPWKLNLFKKAICALLYTSQGSCPENSFFAVETNVRLGRIVVSTANKELSENETCAESRFLPKEEELGCVGSANRPWFELTSL